MGNNTAHKEIQEMRLHYKNLNFKINCLAFVDDLELFSESIHTATEQITFLIETVKKTGLQFMSEC